MWSALTTPRSLRLSRSTYVPNIDWSGVGPRSPSYSYSTQEVNLKESVGEITISSREHLSSKAAITGKDLGSVDYGTYWSYSQFMLHKPGNRPLGKFCNGLGANLDT